MDVVKGNVQGAGVTGEATGCRVRLIEADDLLWQPIKGTSQKNNMNQVCFPC